MADMKYMRTACSNYNMKTNTYESVYSDVEYSKIIKIEHVIDELQAWQVEAYGSFCIYFKGVHGSDSQLYISAPGTYVYYKGIKYEGDQGMYRLMSVLERDKVAEMLDRI